MVHVDLEVLKKVWYNIGYKNVSWTDNQYSELKALDNWQRNEVLKAHKKGIDDRFNFPVL